MKVSYVRQHVALAVTSGKSALYLPHVYGRRIRNWPEHGVRQKGVDMWTETAKGVFVPFTSKWDAATGSRAVPLPYPSKLATMQWATLNDGTEGFYLASEDPSAGAKDIQIEYDSNGKKLKMGFFFPMFLPEGESYSIPRVVMEKYAGSWHVAAKRYRTWWDTCRKIVSMPDSERKNFTGFMMVILKQQNGEVVWPYTDFESLGDAARAHGFRHVEFHGWGVGGHDNFYPEYDPATPRRSARASAPTDAPSPTCASISKYATGTRMTSQRRCLWISADGSSWQTNRNAAKWMPPIPSRRTRSVCTDTLYDSHLDELPLKGEADGLGSV